MGQQQSYYVCVSITSPFLSSIPMLERAPLISHSMRPHSRPLIYKRAHIRHRAQRTHFIGRPTTPQLRNLICQYASPCSRSTTHTRTHIAENAKVRARVRLGTTSKCQNNDRALRRWWPRRKGEDDGVANGPKIYIRQYEKYTLASEGQKCIAMHQQQQHSATTRSSSTRTYIAGGSFWKSGWTNKI